MDKSLPWRVAVCAGVGSCSGNTLVRAERCSAPTLLWKLVFAPFCRCIIPLCPSFDIVRISGHNFRTTQLGPFAYFALFILQFRFVVRLICTPLFAACPAATDHPPRRFAPPLQGWDSDQERFEVQVKQDKQDTRVPLCERSNVRRAKNHFIEQDTRGLTLRKPGRVICCQRRPQDHALETDVLLGAVG